MKTKKEVVADVEVPATDQVLEQSKGKFDNVIVIGVGVDGKLDINSNNITYPFLQYALNKASFLLNVHENNRENAQGE